MAGVAHPLGRLVVRFAELADRNAAEAARGTELTVAIDATERPEDPEEFYDHQLVGLRVETTDGEVVGELGRIEHNAAQDLLVIRTPEREVLFPFVTALVPEVDVRRWPHRHRRPPRTAARSPDAHRRRLDLPRVPRPARALAAGQGAGERAARRARPRPARLDPRPAPHRRRHALRRWRRHGDEARALGRGARRGRAGRRRARRTHPVGRAVHAGGRRRARRPGSTWSSRAVATRASTSA